MSIKEFLVVLTGIVLGATLIAAVIAHAPVDNRPDYRELETVRFDGDFVHIFHDDKRSTTCYVLKSSVSCVKDTTNMYEDLYR